MIMLQATLGCKFTSGAVKRQIAALEASLIVAILSGLASSVPAASEYWVGASGDTNAPTGGTWTTTTPTVWSDGSIATANVGWTAGSAAVFGGTDPQTIAITVGGAISASSLTFNNSGYTFSAGTAQTITASGNPFLVAAAGTSNTIGSNVKVNSSTAGIDIVGATAAGASAGTIIVASNGSLTSSKGMLVDGAGTVVNVQSGGTLTTANVSSAYLSVGGGGAGDNATLVVSGGAISILRGSGSIWLGSQTTAVTANQSGTLTITNGGTVTETGGFVSLAPGSGNVGTLNLDGGTLTTANINGGLGTGQSGLGTSTVNFNGGTLKAQSSPSPLAFINGITSVNVRNGGALINNNALSLIVSNALTHSAIGGDNATDGGLTSSGSGTLTLTGMNTYNGPTTVSAGKLVTTTASTGAGSYSVADGATLEVQVNTAGTSLTNSSLTLGTSSATTLNLTLGGNASSTIPAIRDNGALTLGGTVTINVTGSFDTTGSTNLLISYASGGSGTFVVGSVPTATGGATISLINAGNQLKLIYVQPAQAVKWAVGNGNWDTTSLNWQPLAGGSATNYVETSPVTFDDSASGSSPITVTLTSTHAPASITNSSTKNYIFAGSGISAGGGLIKSGSSTLILDNNGVNSFPAITISGGTLQVGNNDANGSLGSGAIDNESALVFDGTGNLTVANAISGAGTLANNGTGTVQLAAVNSYSGNTAVNAGTLLVNAASTGGGNYTVADGATFGVQATGTNDDLSVVNLTLGSSGNVTNSFMLPSGRNQPTALVSSSGTLALNGTVHVNVFGSGLSSGTYVLVQYSSLTGSGQFVPGTMPVGVWTVTNDTVNMKLEIVGVSGLVWDSGNTNNGATIDPADGTWDLTAGNLVWNNDGTNVAFANGNNAVFAGADGTYAINLGAAVNVPTMTFLNSGYNITSSSPQSITVGAAGGIPTFVVGAGKTTTIGTNVTVNNSSTTFFGNALNMPGGTIVIANGGVFQENTANSWVLDGAGTTVSVRSGGIMKHAGATSGQLAIGANNTGNPATLSVDGGSVIIVGNSCLFNIASGPPGVAGTLTINSGTVSMPAGTIEVLNIGTQAGDVGVLNLNGGTLSVAELGKGSVSAISTNHFNGGILAAVNANYASTFLAGVDTADVRNGGAIIDDGGFAITISQPLVHSTVGGDNAVDGGLTKLDTGTLTLSAPNTYTGNTTISNGILALSGSGAIGNSANIKVNAGATLDVSAVAPYDVGASQTIAGNGSVNGSMQVDGKISPGLSAIGTLTFGNDLTLNGNLLFELNKSLAQSNDLVVVAGVLTNAGTGTLTVSNLGPALAVGDTFTLFSQPLSNGNALTIIAPAGVTFTNNLAMNGSIRVLSAPNTIAPNPTNITFSVNGNMLIVTWPTDHLGWIAQSNSVGIANTNFWFDIAGSDSATSLTNSINHSVANLFYRLRHP